MSKIEVNTIDKACGSTVTIGGSGTNVVLGTSGQSVSIAPGASTSGMGRTGTVDWCSTVYTNSPGTTTASAGVYAYIDGRTKKTFSANSSGVVSDLTNC